MIQLNSKSILELLEEVDRIFTAEKENKENKEKRFHLFYPKAEPFLSELARRLSITERQAVLFAAVFFNFIQEREVTPMVIAKYLSCSPLELFKMEGDLKALCSAMYLYRDCGDFDDKPRYNVVKRVLRCITENDLSVLKGSADKESLTARFYHSAYYLYKDLSKNFTSPQDFYKELDKLKYQFSDLAFMQEAIRLKITEDDLVVYFAVFVDAIEGDNSTDLNYLGNNLFKSLDHKLRFRKKFMKKESFLFRENIIEFDENYYVEGKAVVFTDWFKEKVLAEFELENVAKEYVPKVCKVIKPTSIFQKKLHYTDELKKNIERLRSVIETDKLVEVQKKLCENGLSKGITVMLHGYPGTGKTETVQQLALASGREIYMVDIASIRNKYVGESEKTLKSIFDEYRKSVKVNKTCPILLFNESDALIGRRTEVGHSVDQMENSMQNILLQELESFDGILFATTNLLMNLDKAFERRFLFKLKFEKPSAEIRRSIWKEKMPLLQDNEISALAEEYEFSGGQIDNIAKKMLLEQALNEKQPDLNDIRKFCNEETFASNHEGNTLGFKF